MKWVRQLLSWLKLVNALNDVPMTGTFLFVQRGFNALDELTWQLPTIRANQCGQVSWSEGESMQLKSQTLQWVGAASLALLAGGWSGHSQAARPMNTDDARIVDPKSCQLESWVKRPSGHTEFWAQPACNFTGNLELTVGSAVTRQSGDWHYSAQMMQGKTLLRPLQTNGWGLAMALGMARDPQREAGGGHDAYAYIPVSFSLADDRVVLHTNLGWLREQDSRRNHMTWGLGSETQLLAHTWLIAETYGQGQGKPFYQFGLRHWLVPERVQVDATFGSRLSSHSQIGSQRWVSIGLRLLSPAFLP